MHVFDEKRNVMKKKQEITYCYDDKIRIDQYITLQKIYPSRSQIKNLISNGNIMVNGCKVKPGYILKYGDKMQFFEAEKRELQINAEDIVLDIIFEDDDLIVINKPANMIVHPAGSIKSGTLVNAILFHCRNSLSGIGDIKRPGIVHRLDKNTTGLIVVAKNDIAHISLSKQIKDRMTVKKYFALVHGEIKNNSGIIDAPIGRSIKNRKKMAVIEQNSKNAVSRYQVIKRYHGFTLLEVSLVTGRTHQIRVHLSYIGFPIVGDPDYGVRREKLDITRQALHAYLLEFAHPRTKKYMEFKIPLPEDMQIILESLVEKKNSV